MTKELLDKVTGFRTAMMIVKAMISKGLITDDDYREVELKLAEKYGLKSTTIFR